MADRYQAGRIDTLIVATSAGFALPGRAPGR